MDNQLQPPKFQRSSALFDGEGRLLEWDQGFEMEFEFAAALIAPGAQFREILQSIFVNDPRGRVRVTVEGAPEETQRRIDERIAGFGRDRAFDYGIDDDQILHVQEIVTPSGGLVRVARNVTLERQRDEAIAQAGRARLNAVTEAATWLRRDPDGTFTYPPVTAETKQVLGAPADFDSSDPMSLYSWIEQTPAELAQSVASMEESVRTLGVLISEFRTHDASGTLRWVRSTMSPVREPDGSIFWSGMLRDVTREKLAESQLELLRSAIVHSTDAVLIFDTDPSPAKLPIVLYVNPAFERLTGFGSDEIVGKEMSVFRNHDPDGSLNARIYTALEQSQSAGFEYQVYLRDDSLIWVEARFAVVHKSNTGSARWVVVLRNIEDRRRAHDELIQAKEAAEAGSRTKSEFLTNMSHELRTPLNAIIGFSELIEHGVNQDGWVADYAEYLRDISASGRHLLGLINSILDLSKIEAGMMSLDLGVVDLPELLITSVGLVRGLANEGGVDLQLGDRGERTEIAGDLVKLKQVMLNVLSNAIKFTPSGGKVAVSTSGTDSDVTIIVTDTGCGISKADLQRVTRPFVQVESSLSRMHTGTGLGLSIAKQLCELHHGQLLIDSEEGKGTIVRMTLPRLVSRQPARITH